MKKGILFRRILSVLLSVAIVGYVGYQLYSVYHSNLKTEYTEACTFRETIPVRGIITRQEAVLPAAGKGVVGYCQGNGSKVSAGSVVARVFQNDKQASAQTRIDEINSIFSGLEDLQDENSQTTANAQMMDNKINDLICRLHRITDQGIADGFDDTAEELIHILYRKQVTLGGDSSYSDYLNELKSEKTSLEKGLGTYREITCDDAGYFVDTVDGFENLLVADQVNATTVTALNEYLEQQPQPATSVGKIVSSNEWYFSTVVDTSYAQDLAVGNTMNILVPQISDDEFPCTVQALNVDYNSESTVLVLMCNRMNEKLSRCRKVNAELCVHDYSGLKVDQSALRVIDGVTGVFIIHDIAVAFVPVDLMYTDKNIAICKYDKSGSGGLKIYDEVIIEGSDLYDGKVVR